MGVKIITILHDKDGGFETVETLIEGDAVVMVNFPEAKMTVTTDGDVQVHDRDTGQDITDIAKQLQQGMQQSPPFVPMISNGLIGPTTCFFNGVAVPADVAEASEIFSVPQQYVIQ